jgi:cellulose synthase/poly-beta-1,6-N-acetylglucosamine synthase-like glycosyltransferase
VARAVLTRLSRGPIDFGPDGRGARMTWAEAVLACYLAVLALLSLNGIHRLWMVWVWRGHRPTPAPPLPSPAPRVTVQLPLYNERYVAERLIEAAGRLRYPRDRLQIQVLDDSTDDTADICRTAVAQLVAQGIDAVFVRRPDRVGFKAGALEHGLASASGELLAVFDADFVPGPTFLEQLVPYFSEARIGMVQARWGHLNAGDSWLTRAQATLLDGHFVVEHTARHDAGRWFNFNGTAGIWRRQAIVDAGGWQHDTLTEDLDLSYRAQLAGWTFRYVPEVVAPAELPGDMAGFKSQQHRWAKGSIQTGRKLLGPIWRSPAPMAVKVEATAHLCANFSYPLVILLTILLPWSVVARMQPGARVERLMQVDLVLFLLAVLPFVVFYAAAIRGAGEEIGRRLVRLPAVLALGLGMAVSQSRAVAEGLWGPVGTFVRTPKRGEAQGPLLYRVGAGSLVGVELLLAAYLVLAAVYAVGQGYWASLPFLALFAAGYGSVAAASLRT